MMNVNITNYSKYTEIVRHMEAQNPPAPRTLCTAPNMPFAQLKRPGFTPIEPVANSPVTGSCQHPSLELTAP